VVYSGHCITIQLHIQRDFANNPIYIYIYIYIYIGFLVEENFHEQAHLDIHTAGGQTRAD
jgi:hypothetical protein